MRTQMIDKILQHHGTLQHVLVLGNDWLKTGKLLPVSPSLLFHTGINDFVRYDNISTVLRDKQTVYFVLTSLLIEENKPCSILC